MNLRIRSRNRARRVGVAIVAATVLSVGGMALSGHPDGNPSGPVGIDLAADPVAGLGGGAVASKVADAVQQTRRMLSASANTQAVDALAADLSALGPDEMDRYLADLSDSELTSLDSVLQQTSAMPALHVMLANAILANASQASLSRIIPRLTFLQPPLQRMENEKQQAAEWDFQAGQQIPYDGALYGASGAPELDDANQGDLADCYFHAELLSLARLEPAWVEKNITQNANGTYAVTFYPGGTATTVYVSANLPYSTKNFGVWTYGGTRSGVWIAVYEKAYAELKGGYAAIEGDNASSSQAWTGSAYTDLTGNSSERTGWLAPPSDLSQLPTSFAAPSLETLAGWLSSGKAVVTATTPLEGGWLTAQGTPVDDNGNPTSGKEQNELLDGTHVLDAKHEYVVESVDTTRRTITLANPWGDGVSWDTTGTLTVPWQFTISEDTYKSNFMDAAAVALPSMPGDFPPPNAA